MRPVRSVPGVLIVGALLAALAGCGPTAQTPTAPPAATPAAGVTGQPSTSASPSASPLTGPSASAPSPSVSDASFTAQGWRRVGGQPTLDAVQLGRLVWTGSRFVASGTALDGGAVILDSADGLAWHVQPALGADTSIRGLAVGPDGLVAVGSHGGSARSWASSDGLSWVASPDGAALRPSGNDTVTMTAATPRDGGWLAVGSEAPPCAIDCDGSSIRAIVWTSTDGRHWTRQPNGTSLAHAAMTGVVRGGPGFVAVGRAPDRPTTGASSPTHAVAWTSKDGRSWSRVPDAPVFHAPAGTDQTFGDSMTSVAIAGNRLVAVGTVGTQDGVGSALAWWSDDGRHWSRATGQRFPYGQLFNVAAIRGGFVATGPSGADSCLGGIWSATDGTSWTCDAADQAFDGFAAYAGATSPFVEVVVGLGDTTVGLGTTAWRRDLP